MSKRAFSLKAARRNQHLPLPFVSRRRDMMVRPAAAFALPLTLAACAVEVPPETPPPPAAAYMALGTEPGWTLEITPDRLNYDGDRSEEHTSELQSLMRISYAVFCLKNKK